MAARGTARPAGQRNAPYTAGEFWLEKRTRSKYWQIAWYDAQKRNVGYRSTAKECLEEAKRELDNFYLASLTEEQIEQPNDQVVPILVAYWQERGKKIVNADQASRSIYTFVAFLLQDKVGDNVNVKQLTPVLFERFREWRMGPHSFRIEWGNELKEYSSPGVSGSTVQRNINDIRAAVNHALRNVRIEFAPPISDIESIHKKRAQRTVLSEDDMARILWYSYHHPDLFRFVAIQMMTSVRPTAGGRFNPFTQYDPRSKLIDLQPEEDPLTKKRNAIIPTPRPIRPIIMAWRRDGFKPADSHKTAWRHMRKVLDLPATVKAKTIRYTIATWLYEMEWVPERQISEMLGHVSQNALATTSMIYAQYRPEKMGKVVKGLETIWLDISRRARAYGARHMLDTARGVKGGSDRVVPKKPVKSGV